MFNPSAELKRVSEAKGKRGGGDTELFRDTSDQMCVAGHGHSVLKCASRRAEVCFHFLRH